jgi:hypothetical protein
MRWLVVMAGLGLLTNVASAASVKCPGRTQTGAASYSVSTAQSSTCWDINSGGSAPERIQFIDFPSRNPTRLDGRLQLPNGYVLLDGTRGSFNRFSEMLPGALNISAATGRFSIDATSAFSFILVVKQPNSWAAFLLGSNNGTFTTTSNRSSFTRAYLFGRDASANTVHTPIPASAWLLGSALLGLIGIGRRRTSKTAAA